MNSKLVTYAFIVSLSGFLFGFDSVVISGVNLPLKELWKTSPWFHGTFIISISLWGTAIGALLGGFPTEKLGRKTTLIGIGLLFLISAIGSAVPEEPFTFSFFRFLGGLAAGVASIAAPVYISEISASKNRGRMVMFFQLNLVLGILAAFVSNYLLDGFSHPHDWRYMLGIEALPAFLYLVLVFFVPESPRWLLVNKGKIAEAKAILSRFMGELEMESLIASWIPKGKSNFRRDPKLFSPKYYYVLLLSFLIAFFNQFSGISFVLFYVPEILEGAGLRTSGSLLSTVVVGLVNLVFTFVGIYLIDLAGRKTLMYIGSVGYVLSLGGVALCLYFDVSAVYNVVFLLLFICSHAVGQGAVIWVFISEIFPTEVRSYGQAWGSGVLNVFAALIALLGSVMLESFSDWLVFGVFAGFMVLQLLFTHFMMPETKGLSLETLEKKLVR